MTAGHKTKLMLIGLGNLGSIVLELLARLEACSEVVVASRNPVQSEPRCRLLRLGALAQGCDLRMRVVRMDLNNVAATAETIDIEKPDIIFSTATMSTWWLPDLLPPEKALPLRNAGFGVWLPVHLAPTLELMRAVKLANYSGFTVTAPFPDVVNCMLGKVGLAPTCGIGNVAEMAPKLQQLAADALGLPLAEVKVSLVAHHALERFVFRDRAPEPKEELPPFLLAVHSHGKDVTQALDFRSLLLSPCALTEGPATHFLTAGATVRLVQALRGEGATCLHVPAPSGLPGGYPVRVDRNGIALDLGAFSEEEAISVNERSHRFDGVRTILQDGTAVLEEEGSVALRKLIGFAPERITLADAHSQALELVERFRAYAGGQEVRTQ